MIIQIHINLRYSKHLLKQDTFAKKAGVGQLHLVDVPATWAECPPCSRSTSDFFKAQSILGTSANHNVWQVQTNYWQGHSLWRCQRRWATLLSQILQLEAVKWNGKRPCPKMAVYTCMTRETSRIRGFLCCLCCMNPWHYLCMLYNNANIYIIQKNLT